jgi:hypothetical protein
VAVEDKRGRGGDLRDSESRERHICLVAIIVLRKRADEKSLGTSFPSHEMTETFFIAFFETTWSVKLFSSHLFLNHMVAIH